MTFPTELGRRTLILQIFGFATIIIVGFDLAIAELGDIVVGMVQVGFFMKAVLWLKTQSDPNGRQWLIIQTLKIRFYFTSFWPFEMS